MGNPDEIKSNVPEFSVGELAFSLKKTLEDNYGHVRVRGELSRVSIPASGHMYSSLKDEDAVIDAVCWKGTMNKLSIRPEEGLEVICTGRISSYPARSNYQLIIESMELAGEGALLKMLEERKKKLAAEGLFEAERKKSLPFLPQTIGVITSPTGAVIRDILHRLQDRFPRHVLVWPVLVQGDGAADQIADAISGFQTLDERGMPKPDLLIVARGGGSLEDLMAFNEESVVRAVADSEIPVISAVGHETDTTLCDFAADVRAPTPTGAAEMAVPVRANLIAQVKDNEARLFSGMNRMLSELRHKLEAQKNALGDPRNLLEVKAQQVDHVSAQLSHVYTQYLSRKQAGVIEYGAKLRAPETRLQTAQQSLSRWDEQLRQIGQNLSKDHAQKLSNLGSMLEAYSFKNVLKRGFVVVRDENGKPITTANDTAAGQAIALQFQGDQNVGAVIGKIGGAPVKSKKKAKKPAAPSSENNQQSLF